MDVEKEEHFYQYMLGICRSISVRLAIPTRHIDFFFVFLFFCFALFCFFCNLKGELSGLRQFLAIESR